MPVATTATTDSRCYISCCTVGLSIPSAQGSNGPACSWCSVAGHGCTCMLIRRANIYSKPKQLASDQARSHRRLRILLIVQLNSNVLSFSYACHDTLSPRTQTSSATLPQTARACALHSRLLQEAAAYT
jgi:hypothetical protein